jgi:DNA modification methylase
MDYINKILCGNDLEILPKLPAESVNCVICSPPYWGLRDYGIAPVIWDGDEEFYSESLKRFIPLNCKHDFGEYDSKLLHENRQNLDGGTLGNPQYRKNLHGFGSAKAGFCSKCGAWRGSLGLEPTFELYIKHLCDIFDEVKRVLRKDGTCWVNIGDSYAGGKGQSGARDANFQDERFKKGESLEHGYHQASGGHGKTRPADGKIGIPAKSLCDIPYRFSIEMINRGWTKRNTIIWHKPNCMPESADDRFTVDFEYLFFFSKSNKTLFWTNEKTLECVSKKPSGTKGIEGKDWEWRPCPACSNKDYFNYRTRDVMRKEKDCSQFRASDKEKENIKKKICPRCKGLKKVKYYLWTGHDYWFEQQFEEYAPDTLPRMDRGVNINKWTFGADGQTPHNLSQPRLNKKRGHKTKQNDPKESHLKYHGRDVNYGKYGRNKRCVWKISTKSFKAAHFATFPETLIEPIIKAGCPEFICKKCGMARVKILEPTEEYKEYLGKGNLEEHHAGQETKTKFKVKTNAEYNFKGYTDCGCNAGWESGIVLDPFMGAGTTALVALKQRKRFIGIEIKQEYIDMSYKRIARVQQRIF